MIYLGLMHSALTGWFAGFGVMILTENLRASYYFGLAAGMAVFGLTAAVYLTRQR